MVTKLVVHGYKATSVQLCILRQYWHHVSFNNCIHLHNGMIIQRDIGITHLASSTEKMPYNSCLSLAPLLLL